MKNTTLFVTGILMAMAGSSPAHASEKSFEIGQSKFKMDVPADWQVAEQVYGLPLAILGPESHGRRPVISVTPTEMTGVNFNSKAMATEQKTYQKGRKEWLSQFKGRALAFFPYKNIKWGNADVHQVGYKYEIDGSQFVENSYYVVCNDKLYYLKSFTTADQDQSFGATIADSVRSFSCK